MIKTKTIRSEAAEAETPTQRVVFTMGGKGGVGKTGFMLALTEWYEANEIPVTLLDFDTENKARGSLKHFHGRAHKLQIHTPAGLDAFIDHLGDGTPVLLADMGAGAGQVAHQWFDTMHEDVAALGVGFTAVGLVTPDPASVESVLSWAARLQDRVEYLIVENAMAPQPDFTYWRDSEPARLFREAFHPIVIETEYRLTELENTARQHGVSLGQVAARQTGVAELQKSSLVIRAQSYRRRLFTQFEQAKGVLLP